MPCPGRPALALALALLAACAGGRRAPSPAAAGACRAARVDPARLRAHVEVLAGTLAPRDVDHPENLDRAAAWVADALRAAGGEVREQPFQALGRTHRNVLATFGPDTPERIVVGAHYDAAAGTPGADDDASGVAALVELARLLAAAPPPLRVELAAYGLEEPPAFATDAMGSVVHARALAAEGARVRLMIAVEMIGAYSDEEGSQSFPEGVDPSAYPTRGNFVAVVGRRGQAGMVGEVAGAVAAASEVPVETIVAPRSTPGVDLSDHRSFWAEDFPAVMLTDTAFYRNHRYHTAQDRPDTLDYARMAEVVEGLHCAVQAVARR